MIDYGLIIQSVPLMLQGALVTLEICAVALMIGFVAGVFLGTLNSPKVARKPIRLMIKAYVAIIRGTPLFVQVLIVYFGLPELTHINLSPFAAGVLALSCNTSAYLAEIVRAGMVSVPYQQWDAGFTLGYKKIHIITLLILPQALRKIWPAITNEFVTLIKESSILMILGVSEITKISKDIVSRELKPMTIYVLTGCIYFALTYTISKLASKWEAKHEYS
ncbi:MAG TPA: amino acid ABC transporter permease [Gammaproteobacteria bacterium]|nr:amino acid ABC transporter permease [Gammaproteobacteria bacterium]